MMCALVTGVQTCALPICLLTHHHPDHVGGAVALKELTGATVYGPLGETMPVCDVRLKEDEIGRASCRERVCKYVLITGVAVSLRNKRKKLKHRTKFLHNNLFMISYNNTHPNI